MPDGTVLVTGGAGFIGSHAVLALRDAGCPVVVIDDLSNGVREAVPDGVPLIVADIADLGAVREVIAAHGVESILHFAGSVRVEESVADPLKYYRNNTAVSATLIATARESGIARFVFSSTAAVYGIPETSPVDETAPTVPINPYGWSKLMTERMLEDTVAAGGAMRVAILRYFNVAGADPAGRAGQRTPNATHLIKVASEVAVGKRPAITIFGTDYPTPDGTCVRDYIHVSDLADAHVAVLEGLRQEGARLLRFNCGYGRGYSVREVLAAVARANAAPIAIHEGPRRAGDPPALVSDAGAIRKALGWQPRLDDLDRIVADALAWERRLAGM
ncbi:MAG: UDP-glucose 4-epimerase GalE [Rhodothalassiaceae bacterium]